MTPEYRGGTYAYFVTINSQYAGAYPYTPGPTYYGVVPAGATGPQSGHAVVNEAVQTYLVTAAFAAAGLQVNLYPNPASTTLTLQPEGGLQNELRRHAVNALGQPVCPPAGLHPSVPTDFDLSALAAGMYYLGWRAPGPAPRKRWWSRTKGPFGQVHRH